MGARGREFETEKEDQSVGMKKPLARARLYAPESRPPLSAWAGNPAVVSLQSVVRKLVYPGSASLGSVLPEAGY